jgi:hypothetical protein
MPALRSQTKRLETFSITVHIALAEGNKLRRLYRTRNEREKEIDNGVTFP